MKILHVLDHSIPLHSGYTFRTAAILREQRALGWQTFHITGTKQLDCEVLEEEVDGLHFYRTPKPAGMLTKVPVINQMVGVNALAARLDEVVAQLKPDILHAHSPVLNAMAATKVAKRYQLPLVYEVRAFWEDAAVDHGTTREGSMRYNATRNLETKAFRQVDAITCICEGLRREIAGRGIAEQKITVIPNAVDIDNFPLAQAADLGLKAELGLANCRVIGFIGSFYAYEGLDLLINALPDILQQAPDVHLLLVGGGPQDGALKKQARQLGLADKVIFTGRVPHQQVKRYYELIDLLAYPRYSMRLTELVTPLKPLEAMAQGKLFVASDVGGHKELIHEGETGWLFKAGDQQALAAKINQVLSEPEAWPAIKAAGRAYVETERNWRHSVARYRAIYQGLLNKG